MTFDDYQRAAARTMNTDLPPTGRLSMLAMGLAGEAGELIDHLKKALYHGHDLDIGAVAKEAGDCIWYLANLASELGLDLGAIAAGNLDKLARRYPEGFSSEASKARADVQEARRPCLLCAGTGIVTYSSDNGYAPGTCRACNGDGTRPLDTETPESVG